MDFTRNRIFDFPKLILSILSNLSRTLSIEVYDMIQNFELKHFSKQAFSWARLNLKYTAFIHLNNEFVKKFYEDDYKTYKDRIFLAVDGFALKLPNVKKLGRQFGLPKNQSGESKTPQASCLSLYDILNEVIIDSNFRRYNTSERTMAYKSINKMLTLIPDKKYLLVADRGFPSLGIFFYLTSIGVDFVIRARLPFLNQFKEVFEGNCNDLTQIITIDKKKIKDNSDYTKYINELQCKIKLRVARVEIGENKFEYLVTNLFDENEFPISELKVIYNKRWCIETDIKRKKVLFELENFASKTSFRIKQEFYAKMLIMNLGNIFMNEVETELKVEKKDDSIIINHNIAYGLFKISFLNLFKNNSQSDFNFTYLKEYLKRNYTKFKPNRKFERKPKVHRGLNFHWSQRRSY